MMVSMSESWKEEILEGYKEISFDKHQRMYDRYKKLNKAMQDARDSGEASGDNRRKMGKMSAVIDKSSENLRKKQTKGELTGRGPRKEEVELDENRRAAVLLVVIRMTPRNRLILLRMDSLVSLVALQISCVRTKRLKQKIRR